VSVRAVAVICGLALFTGCGGDDSSTSPTATSAQRAHAQTPIDASTFSALETCVKFEEGSPRRAEARFPADAYFHGANGGAYWYTSTSRATERVKQLVRRPDGVRQIEQSANVLLTDRSGASAEQQSRWNSCLEEAGLTDGQVTELTASYPASFAGFQASAEAAGWSPNNTSAANSPGAAIGTFEDGTTEPRDWMELIDSDRRAVSIYEWGTPAQAREALKQFAPLPQNPKLFDEARAVNRFLIVADNSPAADVTPEMTDQLVYEP
jgi:hypothetical protein